MNKPTTHDASRSSRWLALCLCGIAAFASADTMYLRAGEETEGQLKTIEPDAVVFEGHDGVKTLKKEEITRIQIQQARLFDDVNSASQITDPELRACIAQQPSEKDYPADGNIVLFQRRTIDLTTPGLVTETTRTIVKILRQRGQDAASTTIWYFEDADTPVIDFAITVTPDGRVLHLNDAALKNESVHSRIPDYRRLSRFRFACKEPSPGSILDVQFTVQRKRDTLLEPFYAEESFQRESPILRREVVVIAKPGTAFRHGTNDACNGQLDYAASTAEGGAVRHVWSLKRPAAGIVDEPLMPPHSTFTPILALGTDTTWSAIGTAYREALDALAPLSAPLCGKAKDLAKKGGAQAIYDFVAKTIRSVPVGQNEYRFIPYPPDKSVTRGAANELDKNILYHAMLKAAGIECAFALIRERGLGPLNEDVPSLRAFHRSAVYLLKSKTFSTTISDRLSLDALPGDLQGAKAIVFFDKGAKIVDTPAMKPKREMDETHFDARLREDGELELTVSYSAGGNAQATMRAMKDLDEQQMRHQLEEVAGHIHPGAVLRDYKTSDLADLDTPPSVTLSCTIPGYATKAGDALMLFNLPAADYNAGDVGRPAREHALFWFHAARARVTGTIELPKKFAVYGSPANVHLKNKVAAYSATFRERQGVLQFEDTFDIKMLTAPPALYAGYKRIEEARADLSRQRIILTRVDR